MLSLPLVVVSAPQLTLLCLLHSTWTLHPAGFWLLGSQQVKADLTPEMGVAIERQYPSLSDDPHGTLFQENKCMICNYERQINCANMNLVLTRGPAVSCISLNGNITIILTITCCSLLIAKWCLLNRSWWDLWQIMTIAMRKGVCYYPQGFQAVLPYNSSG